MKTPSGEQIVCPSCRSTDLRWSNKPHIMNFVMAFAFRDPIRCCACGYRFYRRGFSDVEYDRLRRRKETDEEDDD